MKWGKNPILYDAAGTMGGDQVNEEEEEEQEHPAGLKIFS